MKIVNAILMLVAVLATAAAVARWQSLSRLQAEGAVANDRETAAKDMNNASSEAATDIATLREQTKDLPRLRNEVSQLRAATNELVALQKENARLTEAKRTGAKIPAPVPPGFIGKEQLANVGFATPDATLQTFFWAMRETNLDRTIESWSAAMRKKARLDDESQREKMAREFAQSHAEMMAGFNNVGIVEREVISPTEQVLHVRSSFGTFPMKMRFVLEGDAWKLDVNLQSTIIN